MWFSLQTLVYIVQYYISYSLYIISLYKLTQNKRLGHLSMPESLCILNSIALLN